MLNDKKINYIDFFVRVNLDKTIPKEMFSSTQRANYAIA